MPGAAKQGPESYANVKGFCKAAVLEEVREHEYILTPGRYCGHRGRRGRRRAVEEKMTRLDRGTG